MTHRCFPFTLPDLATTLSPWLRLIIASSPLNQPILIVGKTTSRLPPCFCDFFTLKVACTSYLGSFGFSNAERPCHDRIKILMLLHQLQCGSVFWGDSSSVIGLQGPTKPLKKTTSLSQKQSNANSFLAEVGTSCPSPLSSLELCLA